MKKILVTGATGFVGSYLVPTLLDINVQVVTALRQRKAEYKTTGLQSIVVGSIDESTDWSEALQGVDTVIHLAARAHILEDAAINPAEEFLRINTFGTRRLVQQSIEFNVKHFVFISSVGAMATLSDQQLSEATKCQPDTPYGRSKLQAEIALKTLTSQEKMAWTILRPTLVYGPKNPGNMARLLKLTKRSFVLPFGSIHNRRSFVYVENLVDAIVTVLSHPSAINQTFLISDGEDLSTPQLISRLAKFLDSQILLLPVSPIVMSLLGNLIGKSDTVSRLLGSLSIDSQKIRKTLNWDPPFSVDQGLRKTAEWFQSTVS